MIIVIVNISWDMVAYHGKLVGLMAAYHENMMRIVVCWWWHDGYSMGFNVGCMEISSI